MRVTVYDFEKAPCGLGGKKRLGHAKGVTHLGPYVLASVSLIEDGPAGLRPNLPQQPLHYELDTRITFMAVENRIPDQKDGSALRDIFARCGQSISREQGGNDKREYDQTKCSVTCHAIPFHLSSR